MIMLKVLTQYQEATGDSRVHSVACTRYFALSAGEDDRAAAERVGHLSLAGRGRSTIRLALQPDRRFDSSSTLARQLQQSGVRLEGPVRELRVHRQGHEGRREAQHARRQQRDGAQGARRCGGWSREIKADRAAALPAVRRRWTATISCRAACTAATSTMRDAIRRRAPSSARWSRGCSRLSTCSPSSAIRRSGIGSRRSPSTRCPATFNGDMWAHQDDQQPNQVLCSLRPRQWTTNGPESNLFGLEPHFGCCTSNFHQGWPKLVASLWMATPDGGLAVGAYGPERGPKTTVGRRRGRARSSRTTEYPFRDVVSFAVTPVEARWRFRCCSGFPRWAAGAQHHGQRRRATGRASPARSIASRARGRRAIGSCCAADARCARRAGSTTRWPSNADRSSSRCSIGDGLASADAGHEEAGARRPRRTGRCTRPRRGTTRWCIDPSQPIARRVEVQREAGRAETLLAGGRAARTDGARAAGCPRGRWSRVRPMRRLAVPSRTSEPIETLTLIPYGVGEAAHHGFPHVALGPNRRARNSPASVMTGGGS